MLTSFLSAITPYPFGVRLPRKENPFSAIYLFYSVERKKQIKTKVSSFFILSFFFRNKNAEKKLFFFLPCTYPKKRPPKKIPPEKKTPKKRNPGKETPKRVFSFWGRKHFLTFYFEKILTLRSFSWG